MATAIYEPADDKTYLGVLADANANYQMFLDYVGVSTVAWDGWFDDASNNNVASNAAWQRIVARGNNIMWSWRILRGPYSETLTAKASLRSLALGYLDAEIIADAATFRAQLDLGKAVMVRPFHEFSGNWGTTGYGFQMFTRVTDPVTGQVTSTPYRPQNSAADFIAAWRRLFIILRNATRTRSAINSALAAIGQVPLQDGGTGDIPLCKVAFHWCPNRSVNPNDSRNYPALRYPGDAYVDWVGTDAYSRFTIAEVWTNHIGKADGPDWIYNTYSAPGTAEKPFMWTELGTRGSAYQRPEWHTYLFDWIEARPRVKGMLYFNQSAGDGNSLLDSSPNTAAIWRQRVTNSRYLKTKASVTAGEDPSTPGTTTPPTTITDVEITSTAYHEDTDGGVTCTVNTTDADAVLILVGARGTATISAVTGDGSSVTSFQVASADTDATNNVDVISAAYLVTGVAQKASWVATATAGASVPTFIAAIALANVPTSDASRSSDTDSGRLSSAAASLTTEPGDMAFALATFNATSSPTYNLPKLYDTIDAPNTWGSLGRAIVVNQPATGGSLAPTFTFSGGEWDFALVAVTVKCPTNAPPPPPSFTTSSPSSGVVRVPYLYTPSDLDVASILLRYKVGEDQTFADQTAGTQFLAETSAARSTQYGPFDLEDLTPGSYITVAAFTKDESGNWSVAATQNQLVAGTGASSTAALLVAELETITEEKETALETARAGTRADVDAAADQLRIATQALREARRALAFATRYDEAT